jgi:hypothetical protein
MVIAMLSCRFENGYLQDAVLSLTAQFGEADVRYLRLEGFC